MIAKSPSKRIRTSSATSSLNVTGCAVSSRNSALSCSEPSGYEDMKSSAKISSKRFTSPFSTDAKKSRFRAVSLSRSRCAFAFVCMAISSGVRRFLVQLRNEALSFDPHKVFTPMPTAAYSITTFRLTVPDRMLEEVSCGGSIIRIEHDAVSGLARFQPLERFVDAAHRKVFRLRCDVVPRGEFEHRPDAHRRTDRRAGEAPLPHDERDHRERDRFKHEADDVQPAVGSQRGDERVPIERDIDGDQQQIEYPRQFLERVRIAARHDSMRTELPGFAALASPRGEPPLDATRCAPNFRASSNLLSLEVNAVTSQPYAAANFTAMWPNPPMPTMPTRLVGLAYIASGLNTVMPPHRSGPASATSIFSGRGTAQAQ